MTSPVVLPNGDTLTGTRDGYLTRTAQNFVHLEGRRRIGRLDQQRLQQNARTPTPRLAGPCESSHVWVLGTLLEGRIAFTPQLASKEAWYEFAGQASLARVLSGGG
jgi:hypothetical protein